MFKRAAVLILGITLGALAVGGVALASGADGKSETAATEGVAPIVAQAPNARLSVLIAGGTAGEFTLVRQVGVQSVTNPSNGIFCIKAAANTGIKPGKVVPIVSTEFNLTSGYDRLAQWASNRTACPTGTLEIRTFDISDASAFNQVAFTVVVP